MYRKDCESNVVFFVDLVSFVGFLLRLLKKVIDDAQDGLSR